MNVVNCEARVRVVDALSPRELVEHFRERLEGLQVKDNDGVGFASGDKPAAEFGCNGDSVNARSIGNGYDWFKRIRV